MEVDYALFDTHGKAEGAEGEKARISAKILAFKDFPVAQRNAGVGQNAGRMKPSGTVRRRRHKHQV